MTVDATSGAKRADLTGGSTGIDIGASWSPDGKRIAFSRYLLSKQVFEVWVMEADGTNPKRVASYEALAANTGFDFTPHWSPNGKTLAFTGRTGTGRKGFAALALVPAAGGTVKNLGPKPASDKAMGSLLPEWSPDGKSLAFISDYATPKSFEVYTMKPDGTALHRVTKDTNQEFQPTWQPAEKRAPAGGSAKKRAPAGGSATSNTEKRTPAGGSATRTVAVDGTWSGSISVSGQTVTSSTSGQFWCASARRLRHTDPRLEKT